MKIARSVLRVRLSSFYILIRPIIAVALFILIPTSFLLILYVKTSSENKGDE